MPTLQLQQVIPSHEMKDYHSNFKNFADDLINYHLSEKARNDLRKLGYLKDVPPISISSLNAESKQPVVDKAESKDTVPESVETGSETGTRIGSGSGTETRSASWMILKKKRKKRLEKKVRFRKASLGFEFGSPWEISTML